MRPVIASIILAATLTACASTPTPYAPANGSDRGWSQTQIEQDRFRIRFDAGADMAFEEVELMALRRAAEVTLEQGGDWFLLVSRHSDGNDRNPVGVSTGVGISTGSRGYSSRGIGLGLNYDASAGQKSVSLEILVRTGPRPQDVRVYDAREVLANSAPG